MAVLYPTAKPRHCITCPLEPF